MSRFVRHDALDILAASATPGECRFLHDAKCATCGGPLPETSASAPDLPPELVLTEEERAECQTFAGYTQGSRTGLTVACVIYRLLDAQPKDGE